VLNNSRRYHLAAEVARELAARGWPIRKTGNFTGDDIVEMLVPLRATAERLSSRLFSFFAYPNPEREIVAHLADTFQSKRYNVGAVVQEIFGESLIRGVVAIKSNPSGRSTVKGFAIAHEYGIFAASSDSARIGRLERTEEQLARYDQKDEKSAFEWVNFRKHGGANAERAARRKLFYPIYACKGGIRIPRLEWNQFKREWNALDPPSSEEEVIFPINPKGEEKTWKWAHTTVLDNIKDLCSRPEQTGKTGVYVKARINQAGTLPLTWWDKTEYSATEYGTNLLADILGASNKFSFPKSVHAVQDSLRVTNLGAEKWVMDFFAGSGTTAHAAMQMTRDDGERRRFVLVEAGDYFETVLMPRVKKCIYSGEWKDGKPVDRDGISQFVQCCRLESYEDTLNNLLLAKSSAQKDLLTNNSSFREDYTLHYMLDAETNGSRSLLNIDYFEDPFHYTMQIATSTAGETRTLNVDLVETFNYLLGLRVKQLATLNGFKVVEGRNSDDEPVLVIWRNTKEKSNADLDAFFQSQGYGAQDRFNLAYVNGDNNLENLRPEGASWKVLLIEEEFKRLMFDVKDV